MTKEWGLEILPAGFTGDHWSVRFPGESQAIGCFQALANGEFLATGRRKPVSGRDIAILQLLNSAIAQHRREIDRLDRARLAVWKDEQ